MFCVRAVKAQRSLFRSGDILKYEAKNSKRWLFYIHWNLNENKFILNLKDIEFSILVFVNIFPYLSNPLPAGMLRLRINSVFVFRGKKLPSKI